ncbi:putative heat shock protein DNAJ [Leptomonas pyrrhocoris]|uniref:Putative heat shock protein DNAJ n=1 Tax=Leptomonas pyrrhocoris TaxID=157538 RepID=A0A0N0DVW8_LEPPY|nr:putative heat shock protein DNAJ [Leptomonas pyrrhocoris]XP_015660386.1 putative heat shock protein DNAJ [Leptomonas pyrrhocoris]XP_015664027.1 putative heat shock protein DNAJ [Leptomonas pyrrhocoris]KPA80731.1 putative heat shock protein DNAJ [Leptomonas pyrrhocoris]KPA81947.1 putative heat shock protein DNAJ [Leptomonas pyrrhocoris]KPA85588.1 putative heat shock protein DNAJ [Leptomonas pyrrhocoris]|eukprot:XP_015659170.1 putative heat shock protein DNAJ [Leptomonas pyrrhocoris]
MYGAGMDEMLNAMFGAGGMPGMESMGGFGGRGGRGQRARRGRDVGHALPVTLEDLYNGKTVQVERRRTVLCPECKGSGSKKKNVPRGGNVCPQCRGSGVRVVVHQMGMMVQQSQVMCDACSGTGELIDPRNRCPRCSGSKTVEVDAPVSVVVAKGMSHKQQLVFARMADEEPGADRAGDFVVVLQQLKHDIFTRDDCDLHMQHHLSLQEALCGFQFKLTHLDGRELVVRQPRGQITKPGDVKAVVGEGMPVLKQAGKFGDLIIEFLVDYPDRVEESQLQLLRQALPPPKSVDATARNEEEGEVCYVTREDLSILEEEIKKDEEAEDENEGPSAGCAAQ